MTLKYDYDLGKNVVDGDRPLISVTNDSLKQLKIQINCKKSCF